MQRVKKRGVLTLNRATRLVVLVYILIFFSRDTFLFGTNSDDFAVNIPFYVMAVYIGWEFLRSTKKKRTARERTIILAGIILIIVFVLVSFYHQEMYQRMLRKILCIISAMMVTLHYGFDEYAEAFTKAMLFSSFAAILMEVIAYTPVFVILPRMMNTADNYITHFGFAGTFTDTSIAVFVRAYGIFWEPGVFQIYLNLAIIFELFRKHTINWRRIAILTIAVLITFSTSGYIILIWIFTMYMFLFRKEEITAKSIMALSLLLFAILFIVIFMDLSAINQMVFGKLSDGTSIARQASVFVNLKIFFDHPFVGIGMNAIDDEFYRLSGLMFIWPTQHNTNTLLYSFATYGIFYGVVFSFGTYRMTHCLTEKKLFRFGLLIAIFLLYVGENLIYSMLPYILMFYGFGTIKQNPFLREKNANIIS